MPKDSTLGTLGGMLDDLKSRLGFERDEDRYESDAMDNYDDFDDFDEGAYGEYDDYDTGAPVGAFKPVSTSSNRYGRAESSPNLVSINDVKATTPLPSLYDDRSPDSSYDGFQQRNVGGHYVIDATAPAPSSPAYKVAQREAQLRNESVGNAHPPVFPLNEPMNASSVQATQPSYGVYGSSQASALSSLPTPASNRKMTVIRPNTYADVENAASAVKAGNVVVLAMRTTPTELSRRLLDFSFGMASALEAKVECPSEKVYAIARGEALTEAEKRQLRTQAVI